MDMKIEYKSVVFGADPEFFFGKKGVVVGAEKVLPKEGLRQLFMNWQSGKLEPQGNPLVIIDGVQGEFNFTEATCRQTFASGIINSFVLLNEVAKAKKVELSFAQMVEITEEELKSLSPESQQFGCAPSNNIYGEMKNPIVDASKFFYRSAGGHIHLGHGDQKDVAAILANPEVLVPLLDIIVGNTCVLIDRDPGNVERRKVYGRAGEYRLPKHGLEYRTPSNFWLRSYQVMSLVLALSRFAVCVAGNKKATEEVMGLVNMYDIQKAINTNDAELAQKNFDKIKEVLSSISIYDTNTSLFFPFEGIRLAQFEFFVSKGLDHWFKTDILTHWLSQPRDREVGWEGFVESMVAQQMSVKSPVKLEVVN